MVNQIPFSMAEEQQYRMTVIPNENNLQLC